jgi:F0F1-type ATP synthase beta subunit
MALGKITQIIGAVIDVDSRAIRSRACTTRSSSRTWISRSKCSSSSGDGVVRTIAMGSSKA